MTVAAMAALRVIAVGDEPPLLRIIVPELPINEFRPCPPMSSSHPWSTDFSVE